MPLRIATYLRAAKKGTFFAGHLLYVVTSNIWVLVVDSVCYTHVKDCIIPTIQKMQEQLPIRMSSMFASQISDEHQMTPQFDCSDMGASDNFFDSLEYK